MPLSRDLLFEIGTEELPPKALCGLGGALADGVHAGLERARLGFAQITPYASPRRLAVWVQSLQAKQEEQVVARRGPAVRAAFDEDGQPTRAARGFAVSCGVEVGALEVEESEKGAWLVHRSRQPGAATDTLLPEILAEAVASLPIARRMRWGESRDEFVRPVHWLLALYGDEVINMQLLGVTSGCTTRGHRFHHGESLRIDEPAKYAELLESSAFVIPDFARRREIIRTKVNESVMNLGMAVMDDALLDEVTGMVEWPVVVVGDFERRFLELPAEVLTTAMKRHQKYFHLVDEQGRLLPSFVTISNIESRQPEVVREGNERVLRPRLEDAAFFYHQDVAQPLETRLERLRGVVFQNRLGSVYDKVQRVTALVGYLARQLNMSPEAEAFAKRAARLCKCDLVTEMVAEFPELQGTMGRYYALHHGESTAVADALAEYYQPRFAGDALPKSEIGKVLALADRMDSLVGLFGIGQAPTGEKDPFALRRAALGVMRIITEGRLDLDLMGVIDAAAAGYGDLAISAGGREELFNFMMERFRSHCLEAGIGADVVEAVLTCRPTRPLDAQRRVEAIAAFRLLPQAQSLTAANKRIRNILKQAEEPIPSAVTVDALQEPAERDLATRLGRLVTELEPRFGSGDYDLAMQSLAELRGDVDRFFDEVMVMADDRLLRANRLALLRQLSDLFLRVGDLSRLQ